MLLMNEPKRGRGRPKDPHSKRSQGVERHTQPREAFHLSEALAGALTAYCQAQEIPPRRSDVLRVALTEFLKARGHWPVRTST
jgi:hypothetical protein